MRITLVDNLVMPEEHSLELLDVHPHLGLLSLAAVAERDGHVVQIYDPKRLIRSGALSYDETIYDRAAQSLLSQKPDVVGFTSLGCSFLFALNVAARWTTRDDVAPRDPRTIHAIRRRGQIRSRRDLPRGAGEPRKPRFYQHPRP